MTKSLGETKVFGMKGKQEMSGQDRKQSGASGLTVGDTGQQSKNAVLGSAGKRELLMTLSKGKTVKIVLQEKDAWLENVQKGLFKSDKKICGLERVFKEGTTRKG